MVRSGANTISLPEWVPESLGMQSVPAWHAVFIPSSNGSDMEPRSTVSGGFTWGVMTSAVAGLRCTLVSRLVWGSESNVPGVE